MEKPNWAVKHGWAMAFGVVAFIGIMTWGFPPGPQTPERTGLPQGAVRLSGTNGLRLNFVPPWLDDHELLLGQDALDIRTGKTRRLPGIACLFRLPGPLHGQTWSDPQMLCLSPDRKWLLWPGSIPAQGLSRKNAPFQSAWFAGRLDGSRLLVRPRPINEEQTTVAWEPGNKRWVEAEGSFSTPDDQTHLIVYSLDTPQEQDLTTNWQSLNSTLSFAPNGDGLLFSLGGGAAPVMLDRFHLGPGVTFLSSTNYALHATYANGCAPAPAADRVAWLLYSAHSPPRRSGIEKAMSFLDGAKTRYTRSVWVSRMDGGGLRQIVPDADLGSPGWSMGNIQWTPDGRRLCLSYDNALWTVPVAEAGS